MHKSDGRYSLPSKIGKLWWNWHYVKTYTMITECCVVYFTMWNHSFLSNGTNKCLGPIPWPVAKIMMVCCGQSGIHQEDSVNGWMKFFESDFNKIIFLLCSQGDACLSGHWVIYLLNLLVNPMLLILYYQSTKEKKKGEEKLAQEIERRRHPHRNKKDGQKTFLYLKA